MRVGAACRSIAAAHFACDDGRAESVLGTPVGGVDHIGFKEKRKHGREFHGEVRGKALRNASRTGPINEDIELILQMPTGDGDPVRRDPPLVIAVADAQGVSQNPLDARCEMAFAMVPNQGPAPTQQMRETGLVNRLVKASIWCPAVAH